MMLPLNLSYELRRRFAKVLAGIEFHRVQTLNTTSGVIISKTRRRASWLAISMGNLFLRMQRAGVEVLRTDEWLRWERAVWSANNYSASDGERIEPSEQTAIPRLQTNGLLMHRLPGEPLARILADSTLPIGEKLAYVGWALQSLEHLHSLTADWGGGLVQPLSHGDATAENVLIDISTRSACWIDFDTRHRTSLSMIDRHADDVRALVFSAAYHLPPSRYRPLSTQLDESYRCRTVIARFRTLLASDWQRHGIFQLAQAPLPLADYSALREALLTIAVGLAASLNWS